MARNDYRLLRQGTPPDWGPMITGATFFEGEPLVYDATGYLNLSGSDPSDIAGIASVESRDGDNIVHPVGHPITFDRPHQDNEFICANFSSTGVPAVAVPTITRIGEQAGLLLGGVGGAQWFVDVGAQNQLVEITDVLDGNQRSLTDTHHGYTPGAGAQVVFRFLVSLLLMALFWSTPLEAKAEPQYNRVPNCTVANLATCAGTHAGRTAYVTDGLTAADCVTGGGTVDVLCVYDASATAWVPAAMGGTSQDFDIENASPQLNLNDSDCTDNDDNAGIYVACTDPATTAEDCDVNVFVQTAGGAQIPLHIDADVNAAGAQAGVDLWLRYGDIPPATCTPGEIFIDINEGVDTNCTTTADNSICVCVAADTWASTE